MAVNLNDIEKLKYQLKEKEEVIQKQVKQINSLKEVLEQARIKHTKTNNEIIQANVRLERGYHESRTLLQKQANNIIYLQRILTIKETEMTALQKENEMLGEALSHIYSSLAPILNRKDLPLAKNENNTISFLNSISSEPTTNYMIKKSPLLITQCPEPMDIPNNDIHLDNYPVANNQISQNDNQRWLTNTTSQKAPEKSTTNLNPQKPVVANIIKKPVLSDITNIPKVNSPRPSKQQSKQQETIAQTELYDNNMNIYEEQESTDYGKTQNENFNSKRPTRNTSNNKKSYREPSLHSKLRQGDPFTFGLPK